MESAAFAALAKLDDKTLDLVLAEFDHLGDEGEGQRRPKLRDKGGPGGRAPP